MAHVWQGVIKEYRDRLPFGEDVQVVTLGEGGTPLIHAPALSAETGNTVYLKFEGMNPTGSFKDRDVYKRQPERIRTFDLQYRKLVL